MDIDILIMCIFIALLLIILSPIIILSVIHGHKCEKIAAEIYELEDVYCDTHSGDNICKCTGYRYNYIREDIREDIKEYKTFKIIKDKS